MSHGQISMWSPATVDTVAEVKRVVFRPATASDVLKVGDSVCYNWDLAADYDERTTNPVNSGGTTYAEGAQTYNARFLIVEKPDSENLQNYAGVVKALGSKTGADGDVIEIYIPNGAVVPVMAGIYCYKGVTVLAAQDGSYSLENPVYGSAFACVAIAMETVDRTTDGLVWARLLGPNYFSNGNYDIPLRTGDGVATGTARVFERDISFRGLASQVQATVFRTRLKGATSYADNGGVLACELYVEGADDAPAGNIWATHTNLLLDPGCTLGAILAGAIKCAVTEVAGSGSTKTSAYVAPLQCLTAMDDEHACTYLSQIQFIAMGTDKPDGLFYAQTADAIASYVSTGDAPALNTGDLMIPINVAGTTYYLVGLADTGV